MKLSLYILALLFSFSSFGQVEIPELKTRVTDLTNTLSVSQRSSLENKLASLEEKKGSQVVVVLINSTDYETIEAYSIRLAESWKIGRKNIDDGVILLIAKEDRKLRIEVGYGLEGAITDHEAKMIIENIIVPKFKNEDYFGGIVSGVDAIIANIEGEPLPDSTYRKRDLEKIHRKQLIRLVLTLLFLWVPGLYCTYKLGNWKGTYMVNLPVSLAISYSLTHSLVTSFWATSIFCLLCLISNIKTTYTRGGSGRGRYRGGYYGGGSSWGGGSSFGGGFSGGGGGFGGGGASGGW